MNPNSVAVPTLYCGNSNNMPAHSGMMTLSLPRGDMISITANIAAHDTLYIMALVGANNPVSFTKKNQYNIFKTNDIAAKVKLPSKVFSAPR